MKRLFTILITLTLLLGLTACSSTTSSLERASSEALAFHGWQHMSLPGKAATSGVCRYADRPSHS